MPNIDLCSAAYEPNRFKCSMIISIIELCIPMPMQMNLAFAQGQSAMRNLKLVQFLCCMRSPAFEGFDYLWGMEATGILVRQMVNINRLSICSFCILFVFFKKNAFRLIIKFKFIYQVFFNWCILHLFICLFVYLFIHLCMLFCIFC